MADAGPAGTGGGRRFLTVRAGGGFLALPAEGIREVVRCPALTRVPQASPILLGLANLRGQVLPVADLGGLVGQSAAADPEGCRLVVLEGAVPVALAVDAVADLVAMPGDAARVLDMAPLLAAAFPRASTRAAASRSARATSLPRVEAPRRPALGLLGFELAGQEFALPLALVQEVAPRPAHVAGVPRVDTIVVGVATLRDRLVPLVSGRAMLGLPGDEAAGTEIVIVLVEGAPIGLVVDRTTAILRVDPELVDALPAVLKRNPSETEIEAVARLEEGRRLVSILSPERLFREETMRRIRADAPGETGPGPVQAQAGAGALEQFVIFCLGETEFGLPIAEVEEVTRLPDDVTRVPKAPAFVEGVMNLRGRVVPLVDQRRRFGLPAQARGESQRVIVLSVEDRRLGFIVDSVSRILKVPSEAIGPAPDMAEGDAQVIDRVVNLEAEGRILMILQPRELLDGAERQLLAALAAGDESHAAAP